MKKLLARWKLWRRDALSFEYHRRLGILDREKAVRKDLTPIEVQPEVIIEVFWKVLPVGKGPALSLFVMGDEVLKFDCFGPGDGHYHIAMPFAWKCQQCRLYFPEATVCAQIDRTMFELTRNLGYYLQRNYRPEARRLQIDAAKLQIACAQAKSRMLQFLNEVPELQSPRIATSAA
jgi:hypothetical protein